jgi:hypothetical protein
VSVGSLLITTRPNGVRFGLRVTPRSARDSIDAVRDGRLIVRVTAPPVDRAANDAVIRILSERLGVPQSHIRLVSGDASRNKVVEVAGVSDLVIRRVFEAV